MGFINYCKVSLLTSKHVRTDLCISSSSILPFEIKGLSNSSMCLHLPVWPTCKETHPTLPIAGYFAHVQDSLLLLISICIRAHLFPNEAYTTSSERGERKKLWEEKSKDSHVAFINGNDGTLASVLKMICSSCDVIVVIKVSSFCPLVHCVDNVDCIPRLKVLRLAH